MYLVSHSTQIQFQDLHTHIFVAVGQKPFESRISGRKEYLPIVSTLMGAKGSDVLLVNLAEAALEKANWPTQVKTGREAFAVGDNVRNVLATKED